jgi:hypothetical protein
MQLFGDLDVLSFVRISRLNWTGYVNNMDTKRKGSKVFNSNPQGSLLRGRPETDVGTVYKHILKMQSYKLEREVKNRADWEKSNKEAKVHIGL